MLSVIRERKIFIRFEVYWLILISFQEFTENIDCDCWWSQNHERIKTRSLEGIFDLKHSHSLNFYAMALS